MSKTKIEQYPNSLMTVSRLLAERNFKNTPSMEKAKQINKIERENFYKDKEKSKDDVDEFINKLVKIDGYITELTVYFDNSEKMANDTKIEYLRGDNSIIDAGVHPLDEKSESSVGTERSVGSGIRKKKKGRPIMRGGVNSNSSYSVASTESGERLRRRRGLAEIDDRYSNNDDDDETSISRDSSLSQQARLNQFMRMARARRLELENEEAEAETDPEIGRDIYGNPYYESDRQYLDDDGGDDGDSISELTDDYDRISNKNIGNDNKQITFILILLTKILEEINSINLFYKSKIFKKYKNISVFDIELINKELIDLYNKWNDLLQLMNTYSFINVKKLTNKINTQFSKLYGLTKQINPSLNINDATKQQFEISIADDLSNSQKIRKANIKARQQATEDELEDQANWEMRSRDSIDDSSNGQFDDAE